MEKLKTVFFLLALSLAIEANAATFTDSQGIVYNILTEPSGSKPGTCEVGDNRSYNQTTVVIPEYVQSADKNYAVVGVASNAFDRNSTIVSVDLSGCAQLRTIGNHAFSGCSTLTSVNLSSCSQLQSIGTSAFWSCYSLQSVDLSGCTQMQEIDGSAFYYCNYLTSIDLSDCTQLQSIGGDAFFVCSAALYIHDLDSWFNVSLGNPASNPMYYNGADLYIKNGEDIQKVTEATIPSNFTEIGYHLSGCKSVESVTIANPGNITSINEKAFYYCSALTSIDLSGCTKLQSIGASAFECCSALTSIDHSGCTQLQSIGARAFNCCEALQSVDLSNCTQLQSIGSSAFNGCNALDAFYIHDLDSWFNVSLDNTASNPMYNEVDLYIKNGANIQRVTEVTIPATVTEIGLHLTGCTSVEKINFANPGNITSIKNNAFSYCRALTSINLSDCAQLQTIGDDAFRYCRALTSIDLSGSTQLQSIGDFAFYYCSALTSIDLSGCAKLQSIGINVFYNCNALKAFYIHDLDSWFNVSLEGIDSNPLNCYGGDLYIKNGEDIQKVIEATIPSNFTEISWHLTGCKSVEKVTIANPENITSIKGYAFYYCSALTSIDLSDCTQLRSIGGRAFRFCKALQSVDLSTCNQLQTIGYSAFYGCSTLTSVDLSDCVQLQSIEYNAFYDCSALTSTEIPASLTSMGRNCFSGCSKLLSVTCNAVEVPECTGSIFTSPMTTSGTLWVPAESVEAYRADPYWGQAAYIRAIPTPVDGIEIVAVGMDGEEGKTELKAGESLYLTATVTPEGADFTAVKWTCNPADAIDFVVTDDQQKGLTATATVREGVSGSVTIKATVDNTQIKDSHTVNVSGDILLGDANDNGSVTLADVITIANELLVKGTATPSINVSFCFVNADVDKDRELTIVDQTATTNIAMGLPAFPESSSTMAITATAADRLRAGSFTEGVNLIEVSLDNAGDYVSLQADLLLPAGMEVRAVRAGLGTNGHTVSYNVSGDNRLRVLVYSLRNARFLDNGRPLFTVEADARHGSGDIAFGTITAVDAMTRGRSIHGEGGIYDQTTAIGAIGGDADQDDVEIYDLSGRRVPTDSLKPGIYIVRKGAETRKVLVK